MDGGNYIEIAGGKITEIYEDDYNIYADGNIITTASKGICEVGEDNGVSYNSPKDAPKNNDKKEDIKNYWILYDGQIVTIYAGTYGDPSQSTIIGTYRGTSGLELFDDADENVPNFDYRNSKYQYTFVDIYIDDDKKPTNMPVGPVPEGNYVVDLSLDPTRKWVTKGPVNNITTKPGTGIEDITGADGSYYPDWGTIRARLEALPGTKLHGRNFFYFHNSRKGFTHGCIETTDAFFNELKQLRKTFSEKIKVKIQYGSNRSTNGGTKPGSTAGVDETPPANR